MKQAIYGRVVEADGVRNRLITFDDGVIVSVDNIDQTTGTDNLPWCRYNQDLLIFSGFIDIHTHCREDVSGKDTHKEDYATVGRAALSGGVVCVADMPNNPVVPYYKEAYEDKQVIAESRCPIDVLLYAAVNQESKQFGDVPYKAFMGPSTNHSGDLNFDNDDRLRAALEKYRGRSVSFHCENPIVLGEFSNQPTHETRRPPHAESTAIDTACRFIQEFSLRGKICHVSTKVGLETIMKFKQLGVNVTCEVTPHHLYFDTGMLTDENRRWLQMNPPIRPESDRKFLLESLRDGHIDFLATDHAPHTKDEKLRGMSGVPQLDTYGSFVTWLLQENIDPVTIFNMACKNPGEWVSKFQTSRKIGRIAPGYEASFTILDLNKPASDGRPLYTKCGWSPFDLRRLPGSVQTVWYKGEVVVDGLYMKGFV